jgi:hypothetical protein
MKNRTLVVAALAALAAAVPLRAFAQQNPPSYAEAAPASSDGEENVHGRIVSFNGSYDLQVRDNRGYVDDVEMHPGTIINPTGLTLQPGMVVSILGYNAGSYLAANELDTPYTYDQGVPYWDGHPWSYYGPSVSLGLFFGSLGWWHGSELRTGYHYVGGVRIYPNIHVHNIYSSHGPAFHGRDVIAPVAHGGYAPHPGYAPHVGYAPPAGGAPHGFGGGAPHPGGNFGGGAHFGGGGHAGGGGGHAGGGGGHAGGGGHGH